MSSTIKRANFYFLPLFLQSTASLLILVPITTFYLKVEDFGLFALLNTIIIFLGVFFSTPASYLLGKEFKRSSIETRKKLISSILLFEFIAKFLFLIFTLGLLNLFNGFNEIINQENKLYLTYLVFWFFFGFSWPVLSLVLILDNCEKKHFYIELLRAILTIFIPIFLLVYIGLREEALYLSPLLMQSISIIFELFIFRRYLTMNIDLSYFTDLAREWTHTFFASVVDNSYNLIERFFITTKFGIFQLGIFSHAQNYLNVLKIINKSVSRSFASSLFEFFSSGGRSIPKKEISYMNNFSFAFLVLSLVSIPLTSPIISFLTHGKFIESGIIVSIFLTIVFVFIPSSVLQYFLISTGNSKKISSAVVISRLLSFCSLFPFLYVFGIAGAAVSVVMYFFVPVIIMSIDSKKNGLDLNFMIKPFTYSLTYLSFLTINVNILN